MRGGCVKLSDVESQDFLLQLPAIVALGRDDTTMLTLRHLSANLRIIVTVQEPENRKLLKGSGADAIIAPY